MSIDILRRQVLSRQILAYDRYDKLAADPATLFNQIALTIDNRTSRDNPVRLEEDFVFPQAYAWEDEMVSIPGYDRLEYVVPIKGYQAMVQYNRVNINRPGTIAKIERLMPKLGEALIRVEVRKAMNVFRTNPVSVTGQNFFADAHPFPADKGTYDNTLAPNWADPAAPTDLEVYDLLEAVRVRFADNLTIDAEVLDDSRIDANLLIFVHNATHQAAFRRALRLDTLTINNVQVPNPNKGTFTLLRDKRPTAGQENYIEFVYASPGGPRPVIRVIDSNPVVDAIETNRVSNGLVAITMEQMFGMKAGDPSTAIQVQPF